MAQLLAEHIAALTLRPPAGPGPAVLEPLVHAAALHGQAALDALAGTGGVAVGVEQSALTATQGLLRVHGRIAGAAGVAGLAGLLAARTRLTAGVHIAVVTR